MDHRYGGKFIGNGYGAGSGPIWFDDVHCNGTEKYITDCRHNGWGIHNCGHSDDVSVRCNTGIIRPSDDTRAGLLFCCCASFFTGSQNSRFTERIPSTGTAEVESQVNHGMTLGHLTHYFHKFHKGINEFRHRFSIKNSKSLLTLCCLADILTLAPNRGGASEATPNNFGIT